MKIIDVAEFYTDEGGGVKTYINQKLKAASRLGHEMVVVAPGRDSFEEERHGGKVIWVKGPPLPLDPRYVILWRKKRVHEILFKEKADIVEGSSIWSGGHFVGSWNGDSVKSLIYHQDPIAVYPQTFLDKFASYKTIDKIFKFFWNYIKRLSHRFDATVVSGEWLKERVRKFDIHNPIAVPFGIDKDFFSSARRDQAVRKSILKELGLPPDAYLIICVSRYHPEKRLSTIIDGFKIASEKKPMGLIIFGAGPIKKWIEWKVSGTKNIKIMGFTKNRDELANIMASSDYLVHGSAAETFGIVVAEAICSGLPIVVPDRGGALDLADKAYSEIYKTGNAGSLSKALLQITTRKRDTLTLQCEKASKEKIFTVDEHFDNLFSLYNQLVTRKRKNKL